MLEVPRSLLEERRRLGHDRYDEVWEGELHMVPPPAWKHNQINDELAIFFKPHWERLGLGRTCHEVGVKRPGAPDLPELGENVPRDYRTPDRVFLLPERYDRIQGGWVVGGPDAVLEIVSPGDESRAKLPFYFAVGVREVLFIKRDELSIEILRAGPAGFESVLADHAGWLRSGILRTEFRRELGESDRATLHVRRSDEPAREHFVQHDL